MSVVKTETAEIVNNYTDFLLSKSAKGLGGETGGIFV